MINRFTFYSNYYEIIKYLPDKERLKIYDAIVKYMFDNEEPKLNGLLSGIWINIKMPLDNNKKNINNGLKGGRPLQRNETEQKPNNNPKETQLITQDKPNNEPKGKANNISIFLFLISNNNYKYIINNGNIYNSIKEWLEYKQERKEKYTETGLSKLLNKIDNQIDIYGEQTIIDLIEECMSNNYQGIIWDKLKNQKNNKKVTSTPDWFGKEIKDEDMSEDAKRVYK